MPISILTPEQEKRYGRFCSDPTSEQLDRCFYLNDTDRSFILSRRGDHMRLGCALQLGTVRFLGTFLENPMDVPPSVVGYLSDQLGVRGGHHLEAYTSSQWRWRHPLEIRERYGYRDFSSGFVGFQLNRWLYALCWTGTDRPSVLMDRAVTWLMANKVLLPAASTLERAVSRVRTRASQKLWRELTAGINEEQRTKLEFLLVVPEAARQSPLDRLRSGPTLQSVPELARAVARLEEVRGFAHGLPPTDRLTKTRVMALARYAGAAKAQAVARLPEERRLATLLAFIKTLEATAQDDVLDLFEVVVARLFADATHARKEARFRSLRDLDAAAKTLRQACAVLLSDGPSDGTLRDAVFSVVPRSMLEAAVVKIDDLTRESDDPYFEEIIALYGRVQRFLPLVVKAIGFGAMPAGRAVLEAIDYLKSLEKGNRHATAFPIGFVPKAWERKVKKGNTVDRQAWTVCLVESMLRALRKREIFAAPSVRYADPRVGLLDGEAWEAARPVVCRTLGLSQSGDEEIVRLSAQLDTSYRRVAANLPNNSHVRFEPDGEMVLTSLDKLDEPKSLVDLRQAIEDRLPRVELPELLLEIHARTGLADEFTHASEAAARVGDIDVSVCAVLLAGACNTGFEPLVRPDIPALRRSRLSWIHQNYFRAETIARANARLVAAQNGINLARAWGGGEVASADGMRFVVPVRAVHAGPNPRYFGQQRGVTWYNLMSDQYTGMNGIVVPGTLRDSLVLLGVVLEQETVLDPSEIMTDTGAYTDVIFGIFWLLGYQFSPRIADMAGTRFWRVDPKADYGPLNQIATHRAKTAPIKDHWDEFLRLAGSLKLGLVQAGSLIRTLQTNDQPTRLARALQELGRIVKTNYALPYIDDEHERRRVLTQLNRHEGRQSLARAVFHAKRGELRQRYREGQEDQLGALGLVVNAIILWNTIYMDAVLAQLRNEGYPIRDEDVARLSPAGHHHINMLGRYSFSLPEPIARGGLRPLRDPRFALEDAA